jgi:hypothetical protein
MGSWYLWVEHSRHNTEPSANFFSYRTRMGTSVGRVLLVPMPHGGAQKALREKGEELLRVAAVSLEGVGRHPPLGTEPEARMQPPPPDRARRGGPRFFAGTGGHGGQG